MEKVVCGSCLKKKTALVCSDCSAPVCKKCAFFIDEDGVEYSDLLPATITEGTFCPNCYGNTVEPVLNEFNEVLERAKNVNVFDSKQGKETGRIRRIEKPVKIDGCESKEEALMKLAFLTAQKSFEVIVDVKLVATKKVDGKYQKSIWSGSGIPVNPNITK